VEALNHDGGESTKKQNILGVITALGIILTFGTIVATFTYKIYIGHVYPIIIVGFALIFVSLIVSMTEYGESKGKAAKQQAEEEKKYALDSGEK